MIGWEEIFADLMDVLTGNWFLWKFTKPVNNTSNIANQLIACVMLQSSNMQKNRFSVFLHSFWVCHSFMSWTILCTSLFGMIFRIVLFPSVQVMWLTLLLDFREEWEKNVGRVMLCNVMERVVWLGQSFPRKKGESGLGLDDPVPTIQQRS